MDTIFMNFKNSKTSDPHRILLNLKKSYKYVALSNLRIYYTWKNIKKSHKNNTFKLGTLIWKEKLPYRSYSVSDIQITRF